MRKNSSAKLVPPLLATIVIVCFSAFAAAQESGSLGQTDPLGSPANYITLRNDNLALSYVSGANIVFDTYQADLNNAVSVFNSKPLTSNNVPSAGVGSTVSVAGRFLSQNNDQLVIVGRSGSVPNAIKVRFALGGDSQLSNLHARLTDAPDQISVAAGDLDKIPDANGVNHDELVVAYAENDGSVNVAVLNYTDPKASGSSPKYVTQAVAPFKVNLASPPAPFPVNGDQQGFKVSEVLALAIGDFDGDGQNEIALVTLGPVNRPSLNLAMFRYVHPTLSATPVLSLVTQNTLIDFSADVGNDYLLPTISLAAGNFEGTGRADLVLAYREFQGASVGWYDYSWLETYSFDGNLNPTGRGNVRVSFTTMSSTPLDTLTPGRIICLPGLVNYDPANGFNLYRRGVVVLYNDIQPADGDAGALLRVQTYTANPDPDFPQTLDFTNLGGTITLPNQGIGASYAATLGGFGVDGNINNPVWSLAVEQVRSISSVSQEIVYDVFQNINGQGLDTDPIAFRAIASKCPISVCDSTTQNALRPAIQAYDYQGQTVLLGAPVTLTVPRLITTDFVLQDPPTHAYWDEKNQKLVVVSRNAGTNVSLTNKQGVTYSGKSTDTSASSIGGSASETASLSAKSNFLGLFQAKVTAEETAKATYNYDQNQASYNSIYSSRTLTETGKTDADDFIDGRYQLLTIWRYRVLGQTGQDSAGKPLNLYYDVVFPGTPLAFSGPGLSFDWYQPLQEPGNILSYPAPSSATFSPADLGTFEICPAGATDCTPTGTNEMSGPMIGNQVLALGGASQSKGYDYVDTSGHGITVGYQKKLTTSLDIKAGFSTSVGFLGEGGEASFSASLNLNTANSWGNTTTSDSTSSSETGITINVAAIQSTQGYNIYPTLYTTLDGTIKAAFAADPLGNGSGSGFWRGLYGALPDPALNLPLRFTQNGSSWIVNDQSSRKQMRGFFVQSTDPDPVTGQYDNLAQAPVVGQKVRISAQVYNYSTAQSFKNCSVKFCAIKYDSNSDSEVGACQPIGQTTISLAPRATAAAWTTWDTKGFGPTGGAESQDYRIYVKLNDDKKINETYPPEVPNKTYAPGLAPGVDPGQNDEGFGLATVMASAPARPSRVQAAASSNNYSSPAVTFSSIPLAWAPTGGSASELSSNDLYIGAGMPVRLRAQVCSTANSREPVDVVVFDGEASGGRVIAWKRIYVPGNGQCESTWFDWTATRGDHNLVATIDPTGAPPTISNDAGVMTESSLKRASLQVHVP